MLPRCAARPSLARPSVSAPRPLIVPRPAPSAAAPARPSPLFRLQPLRLSLAPFSSTPFRRAEAEGAKTEAAAASKPAPLSAAEVKVREESRNLPKAFRVQLRPKFNQHKENEKNGGPPKRGSNKARRLKAWKKMRDETHRNRKIQTAA